jgi:hypothetical protein
MAWNDKNENQKGIHSTVNPSVIPGSFLLSLLIQFSNYNWFNNPLSSLFPWNKSKAQSSPAALE